MGITKTPGMSRHSSKHSSPRIMHIALYELFSEVGFLFGRCNAVQRKSFSGLKACSGHAQWFVKSLAYVFIEWHIRNCFHDLAQYYEVIVTVNVFAFWSNLTLHYSLIHRINP